MLFDKTKAEQMVEASLRLLPVYGLHDDDIEETTYGITMRATPEAIEALKQSDNPFAGFVISSMVETEEESRSHYDDWCQRSLSRTLAADGQHPGYSSEEVMQHLEEHRKRRMIAIAKLQAALEPEELELLGLRFVED